MSCATTKLAFTTEGKTSKDFECPKCHKKFTMKSNLKTHDKTVNVKLREHVCEVWSRVWTEQRPSDARQDPQCSVLSRPPSARRRDRQSASVPQCDYVATARLICATTSSVAVVSSARMVARTDSHKSAASAATSRRSTATNASATSCWRCTRTTPSPRCRRTARAAQVRAVRVALSESVVSCLSHQGEALLLKPFERHSTMSSSSSSSVAAPAVVDKHAELLKMVNKCTHYKCTSRRKGTKPRHEKKKRRFFSLFLPSVLVVTQHSGAHVLHEVLHGFDRCVSQYGQLPLGRAVRLRCALLRHQVLGC